MRKRIASLFVAIAAVVSLNVVIVDDLEARRFGGGFKFSSSKSYMKPKWGGSKRSLTSKRPTTSTNRTAASSSRSQSGWSGSSGRGTSSVSSRATQSRLSNRPTNHFTSTRQKSAYQNYQSREQSKFKGTSSSAGATGANASSSSPIYRNAANNSGSRSGDYWDRRNGFYGGWDTPNYVYGGAARYGMFDGLFLGYMLGHAMTPSYARMAYHHQNDPGMKQWMRDMEEQAADNAEVRSQLNELKAQMAAMAGTPIDPSYLPPGMDPDLVMAPEVVASLTPTFKLCTADPNGNYHRFGTLLKSSAALGVNVELVNTAGSMENLALLQADKCDGAYVQRNAFTVYAERNPSGSYYFERLATPALEYAHMVCNRDSDVDDVGDLAGKTLLVGEPGSGTEVTWSEFVGMDSNYAGVTTRKEGGSRALQQVATGQADCMMYVASLNTELMQTANSMGDRLVLVPVNDWDFNDKKYGGGKLFQGHLDQSGERVYEFQHVPDDQYNNIQDGIFFSEVETLTVPVDMVASLEWSEKNKTAYSYLIEAVLESQNTIDQITRER